MFSIKWDDSLSVGVAPFDDHHKHLVELLNKTYNACKCNDKENELAAIVNELIDYTRYHLTAEEEFMEKNSYPEFRLHKIEHDSFSEKLDVIQREIHEAQKNPSIALIDLAILLGNWLSNHILKVDKRFGAYLTASETSQAEHQKAGNPFDSP